MILEGSCHCGCVTFSVNSPHPYPFNLCYCTICRKTAGGGGYAINLGAVNKSLQVEGIANITVYKAWLEEKDSIKLEHGPSERHFCSQCGAALWVWDSRWPEEIYPFASAIDTVLPVAPEHTHMMLDFKAAWVEPKVDAADLTFAQFPDESIAGWHERLFDK